MTAMVRSVEKFLTAVTLENIKESATIMGRRRKVESPFMWEVSKPGSGQVGEEHKIAQLIVIFDPDDPAECAQFAKLLHDVGRALTDEGEKLLNGRRNSPKVVFEHAGDRE